MKLIFLTLIFAIFQQNANGLIFEKEYFDQYKGHTVYTIFPKSEKHMDMLEDVAKKLHTKFDFWTDYRGANKPVDVMIPGSAKATFLSTLRYFAIEYSVKITDVGSLIEQQMQPYFNTEWIKNSKLQDFNYSKYHTLDEINRWMNDLEQAYPKYVTIFNVTRSYQQRDIKTMKISIPNASKKLAIWLDGGIHAREWFVIYLSLFILKSNQHNSYFNRISHATVVYIGYSVRKFFSFFFK
jgi:hypothetical protein